MRDRAEVERTRAMSSDDRLHRDRLVCLLSPLGHPESVVAANSGSISIIGYAMFTLLRTHGGFDTVALYDESMRIGDDDILLIMMCLPDVPINVIKKFRRVVYYFDDMNEWKAEGDRHRDKFARVDLYLSPVRRVAERLNALGRKRSHHMPWSMPEVDFPIRKTAAPSMLIDMDARAFTRPSIENGFALARIALEAGIHVVAFAKFRDFCPEDLRVRIKFANALPHRDFLRLLANLWFYASGIKGSYEYCVLESAMLGCGLMSIKDAVLPEHRDRRCFVSLDPQTCSADDLRRFAADYRPAAVMEDAAKLYPRDATRALRSILASLPP
jgi:hypothetical protein